MDHGLPCHDPRYGAGQPRIAIRRRSRDSAALRALTRICPGNCFRFERRDRVQFASEGCTYCGICRTVCGATGEIYWAETRSPRSARPELS